MTSRYLKKFNTGKQLLEYLNTEYHRLHSNYEKLFWSTYMGISNEGDKKVRAEAKRDEFRSSRELKDIVINHISKSKGEEKRRLKIWLNFFQYIRFQKKLFLLKREYQN